MARPFSTSPSSRVQPGSVRRPGGLNDAVLRGPIGHTTGDIRLTPTAATIVGSAAYNLGKVDDRAIGTYRVEFQGAASATAEALGAINRVEFTIYEQSAGVYLAKINIAGDADGGITAGAHLISDDADDEWSPTVVADNTKALVVVDAAVVTAYSGVATAEVAINVGDLLLFDGSGTGTRVYSVTRLS
jgi:hypothetical protein